MTMNNFLVKNRVNISFPPRIIRKSGLKETELLKVSWRNENRGEVLSQMIGTFRKTLIRALQVQKL